MYSKVPVDYYQQFRNRFKQKSDLELIQIFNSQVRTGGSGSAKIAFHITLREELKAREIDLSVVCCGQSVSYLNQISLYVLKGRKFVLPI